MADLDPFLDAWPSPPKEIVPDLDNMGEPLHGNEEDRRFHGYLPFVCGDLVASSRLQPPNPEAGSELARIVESRRWPETGIRGDNGFRRDDLMTWRAGKPGSDAGFAPEKAGRRGGLKSRFLPLHIGCPVPDRDRTDRGSAIAAIRQTCCSTGGYVRCARSIFPPFTAAPSASTG